MKKMRVFALVSLLLVGAAVNVMAQNIVKGRVVDQNGEPVVGAAVYLVENPTKGVVTDLDGNWALDVAPGSTIHISSIGFLDKDIKPGNQAVINVTMDEDINMLNDVVVIGYGTVRRKNFTGAVSTVKVADSPITQQAMTNPVKSLKGTVTGIDVGAESVAGDEPAVLVRGLKSKSAFEDDFDNLSYGDRTSSPLIVLDGVIYTGTLRDIDPNIIQEMSVLKDATSLAAYGSQAANGVIMITTKQGKTEKPVINFNTSLSLSTVAMKPELMSMDDYLYLRSMKTMGKPDADPASYLDAFEREVYNSGNLVDGLDYVTRTGSTQTYSASVSGVTKKLNYFMSATHDDQKGVVIGDNHKRSVFNVRLQSDITDWLQVGLKSSVAFNDYSGYSIGVDPNNSILSYTLQTMEDILQQSPYAKYERPNGKPEAYPTTGTRNPLWPELSGQFDDVDKRNSYDLGGHILLKAPWLEGLSLRINGSYRLRNDYREIFMHEGGFVQAWDGTGDPEDRYKQENTTIYLAKANGTITNVERKSWVWDNILNYNRTFGDHFVDATLVYTRDFQDYSMHKHHASDFADLGDTNLGAWGLNKGSIRDVDAPDYWMHSNIGYLARLNYAYKDKYHLSASVRRDGSSVFGANHKWGIFPAFGAAWTVTNEPFMAGLKPTVSYLKLKASWGKNGNQSLAPYQTLSTITMGKAKTYYPFGNNGKSYFQEYLKTVGNTELGWETTTAFNYGFDLGLFNDRILLEVDAYKSTTIDQIVERKIPVIINGLTDILATMGRVENKGIEANLTTRNIVTKDWNWTTKFSFYLNRNKLVDLYNDGEDNIVDINHAYILGEPLGIFFGYQEDGIIQAAYDASGQPIYDANGKLVVCDADKAYFEANGGVPGDAKFKNVDDDIQITPDDRQILGNRYPNFQMSLQNTLSWRSFELYMLFTGKFGGNGYCMYPNGQAFVCYDRHTHSEVPRTVAHGWWTVENRDNVYPRPDYIKNEYEPHMSYAYVRLQNLSLAYKLNSRLLEKSHIGGLKVYASLENFFTWTNWVGGDPETQQQRGNYRYPFYKTCTFGINLSF